MGSTRPALTQLALGALVCLVGTVASVRADIMGSAPITGDEGTFGGAGSGTVDSVTGTATASYPFALPPGRGGVQPSLGLHYVHTRGPDVAGEGWSLGLPAIELRGIAGRPPRFDGSDHYELSGAQLAEICTVVAPAISTSDDCRTDRNPSWADGWVLYRFQVERTSTKVLRSADALTWRVLQPDGGFTEFGVPPQTADHRALDVDRRSQWAVRWNIVGQSDAAAGTRNVVRYVWKHKLPGEDQDRGRLEDVYYTAPTAGSLTSTDEYAHHIHLNYDERRIPLQVQPPMALRAPDARLRRIAIASRDRDVNEPRQRVRVYELLYHTEHMKMRGRPFLAGIKLWGRCGTRVHEQPIGDDRDVWQLPQDNTACADLPPTTFDYTEEAHFRDYPPYQDGILLGGFRQQELRLPWTCPHPSHQPLLGAEDVALIDINRDGLADIVQSHYTGNPIFLNKPQNGVSGDRDMSCAALGLNQDSPFAPVKGLTAFGYWGEHWPLTFLRRKGGPAAYDDGFPKEFRRIVPDQPVGGTPQWKITGPTAPSAPTLPSKLPPPHLLGDLDSDGLVDAIHLVTSQIGKPIKTEATLSLRNVDGTVAAFSKKVDSNLALGVGDASSSQWPAPRYAALADMNGDGLLDYVTTHDPAADPGDFVYLPGRGDGTFGCEDIPDTGCEDATAPPGRNPVTGTALKQVRLKGFAGDPILPRLYQNGANDIFFHDVNGDGRADLVSFISASSGTAIDVFLNLDGRTLRHARLDLYPDNPQFVQPIRRLLFADMNGNGVDDIVLINSVPHPSASKAYFFDLEGFDFAEGQGVTRPGLRGGPAPGLLRRINHGGGATTEYWYDTVASLEAGAAGAAPVWPKDPNDPDTGDWRYHSPMPLRVVTRITTQSNAPSPYDTWSQTTFAYREPVFDTWRGRFRGFRRVRSTVDIDSVDTKFLFGGCLAPDGWEPALPQTPRSRPCANPETDKGDALQGLPIQVEHLNPVKYASTTRYTYRADDRSVTATPQVFTYAQEVNTFLYDTAAFVPAPKPLPINVVDHGPRLPPTSDTVLLRAEPVRLRQRQSYDGERNLTDVWDDGRVVLTTSVPVDRPILSHVDWQFVAGAGVHRPSKQRTAYDGTGQVVSLVPDGPAREVQFTFDPAGRLRKVEAPLSGALPLERWHESGSATPIAPEPASAATNGVTHTLLTLDYDPYGNVTESQGADGQCERIAYSQPYMDLPQSRTRFVSGCGAMQDALVTMLDYDRGLGALTSVTSPSLSRSIFRYDLLGRVSGVEGPDPSTPQATLPEVSYEYEAVPKGPVHWVKVTRQSADAGNRESWHYANSLGQPIVTLTQADPGAGDAGPWIADPGPTRDLLGRPDHWFRPWFYNGAPGAFPVGTIGAPAALVASYELGRLGAISRGNMGEVLLRRDHHGLTVDVWDAENVKTGSPHAGAFARLESDGHGRIIRSTKEGNAPADTRFEHLPTGEVVALERRFAEAGPMQVTAIRRYLRWSRFDSLGRMVENAEPNTTSAFTDDPADTVAVGTMRAWRYAYDKSGRLVGTRDARGCGKNLVYDRAGRLLYEDYSPCQTSHESYTAPNPATGDGTEVFNIYDAKQLPDQPYDLASKGRLVAVQDRGSEMRFAFDGRGRAAAATRRMAKPGASSPLLASRYAAHLYAIRTAFDGFDRSTKQSTGADAPELLVNGVSEFQPHYSARGLVTKIESSYGPLLTEARADADGFVTRLRFGDVAGTLAEMTPDVYRRLETYKLSRTAGPWAAGGSYVPPGDGSTLQAELVNQKFHYDLAGNITQVEDLRDPQFWPAGAKPTELGDIKRDAQYRVTQTIASHGNDAFVSPFNSEIAVGSTLPVPQLALPSRPGTLSYTYDGFGNLLGNSELPQAIYDRGLSNVTVGHASGKPNQLVTAANGGGEIAAFHDAAGNLVALDLERTAPCLGPGQGCSQRFLYDWDEVNQLARVQRWDYASLLGMPRYPNPPAGSMAAGTRNAYSRGERVIRTVSSAAGDRHVVDVFGSLRLDRTTYDAVTNDYDGSAEHQHVYLAGFGKVVHAAGLPQASSDRHVFFLFNDHLGSTSAVVDKDTSELVEYRGYQPYGATDYDYRPARWQSHREDIHFTGKEEDVATGLIYFGARHYSPHLQRFVSADPLTVHGWGGDANPYAYVGGRVVDRVDPLGLDGGCLGPELCPAPSGPDGAGGGDIIQIPIDIGGDDRGGGGGGGGGSVWSGLAPPFQPPPPPPQAAPPGSYTEGVAPYNPGSDMGVLQHWVWGGSGTFHDVVTSDRVLKGVQNYYTAVTAIAATTAVILGTRGAILRAMPQGGALFARSGPAAASLGAAVLSQNPGAIEALKEETEEIGPQLAAEAQAMASRLSFFQSMLHRAQAYGGQTLANLRTTRFDIIGGGTRDISPAIRNAMLSNELEVAAKLPGAHAERTTLYVANILNQLFPGMALPRIMVATSNFCTTKDCQSLIIQTGGIIVTPRIAVWPQYLFLGK